MKTLLAASLLVILPIVFAGDSAKMWEEIKEELKEKMSKIPAYDDYSDGAEQEPQGWEGKDHKGWGEQRMRGWENDRKKVNDDQDASSEDAEAGWGRKEHRGWGEHRSRGWGDKKKSEGEVEKVKRSSEDAEEKSKGWEHKAHKGWGNYRSRGWGDDNQSSDDAKDTKVVKETDAKEQEVDDSSEEKDTNGKSMGDNEHRGRDRRRSRRSWDDDDVKEDVREKYYEFKDYLKRKALKENEEQEAKAEIYRQMERVQMKKFLTEKLEQVMDEYEDQKMKFIFQTTGHFLGLCQDVSNSRAVLERLDNGHFAVPEDVVRWSNDSDLAMDMNDQMEDVFGPMNSTFPQMLNDPDARQARVDLLVGMNSTERVKLVLHGYVKVMCTAAQHLTSFVEMVESHIVACKQGLIRCDPFPQ